jgi:hypothetical protein
MKKQLTLLFGGDTSVGEDSARYFEGVNKMLADADFRIIHLEEPYVSEVTEFATANRTTDVLAPLIGKVDLMTMPANHFYDFGERGVKDSIEWCRSNGIACCGAGSNVVEASKPAFVEKDGVKVGVLAYNAVGPKYSFADEKKGGTAYVNFIRAYVPLSELDQRGARIEQDIWQLKEPIKINEDCMAYNFIDIGSYDKMAAEVYAARQLCDILLVYLHKGYVHKAVTVAPYERLISHICIDNGADAVMGTHSHILHGIEMYKGKAIYHGLNNFVMWVPHLSPLFKGKILDGEFGHNEEHIKKRVERFGFVPDPEYPTYPFHPDSVYCMTAKLIIEDKRIVSYRLVPMKVERNGVPYVHGHTEVGQEILDYIEKITRGADLNAGFKWDGDDVVIS